MIVNIPCDVCELSCCFCDGDPDICLSRYAELELPNEFDIEPVCTKEEQ